MNRTIGLLTKMLLVVSLLFGVVTLVGTTAEAQHRHWRGNRGHVVVRPRIFLYPRTFYPRSNRYWYNRPYFFPSRHVTEAQGFHDGRDDGKNDARDRERYNPYKHNDYKNARTSAYLDAYLRGYAEGYREYTG